MPQFIITPKASRKEKDKGLDHLPDKFNPHGSHVGRDLSNPKVHLGGMQSGSGKNNHPTVKPIKLMTYLITLGSSEGDVVLDPFAGSGTTGIACIQTDRDYILIEKEKDYYDLMGERLHEFSR